VREHHAQLGAAQADDMVGVHVTLLSGPRDITPEPQTADELAYVAELLRTMGLDNRGHHWRMCRSSEAKSEVSVQMCVRTLPM
jgi:hypothetical protein